jgi:hypothetical protein
MQPPQNRHGQRLTDGLDSARDRRIPDTLLAPADEVKTGRTHGCTHTSLPREILLANPEPSTHGTKQKYQGLSPNDRF